MIKKIGAILIAHGPSSFFHAALVIVLTWVGYWWWGHDGAIGGFGAGIFFYFMKEFGIHHSGRAGDFWRAFNIEFDFRDLDFMRGVRSFRLSPDWVKVADSALDFFIPLILGFISLTFIPT